MPPDTLALLEPDLRKVSLEAGAVLLEPGELIENIYFPLTGLISLMVIGKNDRPAVYSEEIATIRADAAQRPTSAHNAC
jgi:CRP-like cAMP-binding protein